MNVDCILETMNRNGVAYLLIGGMNFLLRHQPVTTYDVDFWIEDTDDNVLRCEKALIEMKAEWGTSDQDWKPVSKRPAGWLKTQTVFCLTSPHGAIDIFRSVQGLGNWKASAKKALSGRTQSDVPYRGLSDEDMLACQRALDPKEQKPERIRFLESILGK